MVVCGLPPWYDEVMPKRTVFIRDGDVPMWERAERAAGPNLSAFLSEALRAYLDREEFKEMSMQIEKHGEVTKRILYVWGSRQDDGRTAWGTSFASDGTGPDQAQALVRQMQNDSSIHHIEMEERRVYADRWVDRRPLVEWTRNAAGWTSTP